MGLAAKNIRNQPPTQHRNSTTKNTNPATWGIAYVEPLMGIVDGEPVHVLQMGDLPGASPIVLCIGASGEAVEVAQSDCRIYNDVIQFGLACAGLRARTATPGAAGKVSHKKKPAVPASE